MPFVRIFAINTEDEAEKCIILTHINEQHQITDREWFGYSIIGGIKYPFILQPCSNRLGKMELFYDDDTRYPTNILTKQIIIGEYFTVFDPPDEDSDENSNEYLYKITDISCYEI